MHVRVRSLPLCQDCKRFVREHCRVGSNPDYPWMQQIFTTFVSNTALCVNPLHLPCPCFFPRPVVISPSRVRGALFSGCSAKSTSCKAISSFTTQVTWRQMEQYLFPRLRDIWDTTPFRKGKPLDPNANVFLRKVKDKKATVWT